ncbi:MAG: hypothetical protein ACOYNY_04915 [Caldilineaceae bacterium]
MAKEKQVIKRLAFTEDEADQALLAAAEARVAVGEFAAFTDVCRAALQAFLTPDGAAVTQPTAPVLTERSAMAQLEQTLATVQATQQAMHQLLQQVATQHAPLANNRDGENATLVLERLTQLAQGVAAVQVSQQTLQAAHEALQAAVRHLDEGLTLALGQLPVVPAPVNGAHKPTATITEPAPGELAVSQATVNRLARFLEDF